MAAGRASAADSAAGPPRSRGRRRIILVVLVLVLLLAVSVSGTLAKRWYNAVSSLASLSAQRRIVPGSTESGARALLPDEEYRLSDQRRAAALEGAPAGSDCHFYATTTNIFADDSGVVLRVCYDDEAVVSADRVQTQST